MKKIIFTNEQKQNMKSLHEAGTSLTKIAKQYNVSRSVITRIFKENDFAINYDKHKYKADYRKFENIDTAEKAYWLGFIAADGCVYVRKENASIKISIHQEDREHLEKFKKFMNSDVNILDFINAAGYSAHNPTPMCQIVYNSKDMAQDFIKLGIVPRKSLLLQAPNIEERFYLPYILGYFDGDGTIYKFNNNTEFGIGFTGTLDNISWINQILGLNAALEQRYAGSETYYIRCGGTKKPYEFLKKMYDSVDVHLDRKYNLFKELEAVVLSRNAKRLSGRKLLGTPLESYKLQRKDEINLNVNV